MIFPLHRSLDQFPFEYTMLSPVDSCSVSIIFVVFSNLSAQARIAYMLHILCLLSWCATHFKWFFTLFEKHSHVPFFNNVVTAVVLVCQEYVESSSVKSALLFFGESSLLHFQAFWFSWADPLWDDWFKNYPVTRAREIRDNETQFQHFWTLRRDTVTVRILCT